MAMSVRMLFITLYQYQLLEVGVLENSLPCVDGKTIIFAYLARGQLLRYLLSFQVKVWSAKPQGLFCMGEKIHSLGSMLDSNHSYPKLLLSR